jgi:4-hydroxy-3-polyprenylbenzoate decarboxylase
MSLAKVLVVVDSDVNVRNTMEAWWAALNNMDPERDVRFTMGPVDVLDHASRAFTYGSKMGIDATRKWPEEGAHRAWPKMIAMDDTTKASVDAMWSKLGLPNAPATGRRVNAPTGARRCRPACATARRSTARRCSCGWPTS